MKPIKDRNVWLLSLAQALHVSAAITAVAMVGLLGIDLASNPAYATFPNAMLTIGVALSTIPLSYFMKHYSRKHGFLLGAFFGLASFAIGLSAVYLRSFPLLCLASFLQGIYQATVLYYRFAAAETVGEKERSIAISMVMAGSVLAALFAPSAARAMNEMFMPTEFAGAYIFMLLLASASFVPLLSLHRNPKKEQAAASGHERPLMEILKKPRTVCAITAGVGAWASMVFLMSATPIAMQHRGFMFEQSSLVIQWHVLGMYVPSLFSGYLTARIGILRILFAGLAALAGAIYAAFSGQEFIHFGITLVLIGVGWNFLFLGGTTLLTFTHNDAERAKVQGVNEFTGFIIAALAAGLSGTVLEYWDWNGLLYVELAILLVVLSVTLWYAWSERRNLTGSEPSIMKDVL